MGLKYEKAENEHYPILSFYRKVENVIFVDDCKMESSKLNN
jgi:hypothetical protein